MNSEWIYQHIIEDRQIITIRDALAKLINTDLINETREFLVEHPRLLSKDAIEILVDWSQKAEAENENAIKQVIRYKHLLEIVWLFCVEAPVSIPINYKSYPELTNALNQAGIYSIEDLTKRAQEKPDLRQNLAQVALHHLPEKEWAIILIIVAAIMDDEMLTWVQELPQLLEYDVNFQLNTLADWASRNQDTQLVNALNSSGDFLKWTREEINAGRLKLHKMHIWRLIVKYVNTQSGSEIWKIIRDNSDILLSDDGFQEMEAHLSSAFAAHLIMEGTPYPLISSIMHLELLNKCRDLGVDEASNKNYVAILPMELWAVAGILRAGSPSIRSWEGFQEAKNNNPKLIESLAKSLKIVFSTTQPNTEKLSHWSILKSLPSTQDYEILERLALVQFAFRRPPTGFVESFLTETLLTDSYTLDLLENLINRTEEREQLDSAEAIIGLLSLVSSPYLNSCMTAIRVTNSEILDELLPTGAHLAIMLGGIAQIVQADSDQEKLAVIKGFSTLASKEATGLLSILIESLKQNPDKNKKDRVTARLASKFTDKVSDLSIEFSQRLELCLPLVSSAAEMGPWAAAMEHVGQKVNMPLFAQALLVWAATDTLSTMSGVVKRYPILLSDEALLSIENMITSQIEKDDIKTLDETRKRYSILLYIQREKREDLNSFKRQVPDLPGSKEAAELLMDLEITIPAGIWAPVSRVDLTETFFKVLASWQHQIVDKFGLQASNLLDKVAIQTREWLSEFGEARPEHSRELIQLLLNLLHTEDSSEQFKIIQANPKLQHIAAEEILIDWLVSARAYSPRHIKTKIETLIQRVVKSRRGSPFFAFLDEVDDLDQKKFHLMKELWGVEEAETLADLNEAISNLPLEHLAEILKEMPGKLAALVDTNDPDVTDELRKLRISTIRTQFEHALRSNSNIEDFFNTQLPSTDQEAIDYLQKGLPPEAKEQLSKIIAFNSDPSLKTWLEGDETDEDDELERLAGLVTTYLFIPNWRMKFQLLKKYPELFSSRSLVLADFIKWRILDTKPNIPNVLVVTEENFEQINKHFLESLAFLRRCQEVGLEVAVYEKQAELSGQEIDIENMDLARLLTNLSPEMTNKFLLMEEDPIGTLNEIVNDTTIDDRDRATLQAMLGLHYKARFETDGWLEDLDNSIAAYRKSLELTRPNSLDQAVRLRYLANSLIARFENFGSSPRDIDEAITTLRKSLAVPRLDQKIIYQSLGPLGMALTLRCEAFGKISDLEEAIPVLEEAIRITPPGTRDWIGWHINLGAAWTRHYYIFKDFASLQKASEIYKQVLSTTENEPDLQQIIRQNLVGLMSEIHQSLDVIDLAIEELESTINIQTSKKLSSSVFHKLGNLFEERFEMSLIKSDLDQSIRSYNKELAVVLQESPDWAMCLTRLAGVYKKRGQYFNNPRDFAQAADIYEKVLRSSLIYSWPNVLHVAAENLGNLYSRQGSYINARQAYSKAIDAVELMRRTASILEEKIHYSKEHRLLYGRQVQCCLKIDDTEAAFEYAVAAKGRAFVDMLASAPFEIDSPDPKLQTLLTEVNTIQVRLQHLRGLVTGEVSPRQQVAGVAVTVDTEKLWAEIDSLQSRETNIWQQIRYEYPQYAATQSTSPLKIQRAQELAGILDATLLEFYLDAGGWGAFVITTKDIRHVRLANVDPPWQKWWFEMFTMYDHQFGSIDDFKNALREIYDFFFAPLEAYLPPVGSKLVIAPHSLMSVFPLSAVLKPNEHYLLDDYTVAVSPTLSVLDLVVGKSQERGHSSLLTVEHPGRTGIPNYLDFVGLETTTISKYFSNAVCLRGEQATPTAIINQSPQQNIIHFACHGIYDWQKPDASGLMLPEGAWLTVPDVFNRVRLPNASLVVLSACEVGREHIGPGDEHSSLIRGFMYAGAPGVIASLWSIPDLSTMLLMTRFYQELKRVEHEKERLSPAITLRNAQIWLRDASRGEILSTLEGFKRQLWEAGDKVKANLVRNEMGYIRKMDDLPFDHPYFWAAFQAIGDVL